MHIIMLRFYVLLIVRSNCQAIQQHLHQQSEDHLRALSLGKHQQYGTSSVVHLVDSPRV